MNTNYIYKIYSGAVFSGILLLALFGISASNVMAQQDTSDITVTKLVCDSIGQNNTCNQRNNGLEGRTIEFTVFNETLVVLRDSIFVQIGAQGNGSQGSASGGERFIAGTTVLVCENLETAPGFTTVPRPTGGNQTLANENCIRVTLVPGNNTLSFINVLRAPTAATATIGGLVTVDGGFVRGNGRFLVSILNTTTLETQVVFTNRLGYYEFNDLSVGDTYVVNVRGKGYTFAPQIISLAEDSPLNMFGTAVGRSGSKGQKTSLK